MFPDAFVFFSRHSTLIAQIQRAVRCGKSFRVVKSRVPSSLNFYCVHVSIRDEFAEAIQYNNKIESKACRSFYLRLRRKKNGNASRLVPKLKGNGKLDNLGGRAEKSSSSKPTGMFLELPKESAFTTL